MGLIVFFLQPLGWACHMMRLDIASVETTIVFFLCVLCEWFSLFLMSMKDDLEGQGHRIDVHMGRR